MGLLNTREAIHALFSLKSNPQLIRQYQVCLAINAFLSIPLILYIPQYIDDYYRSYSGDFRWTIDNFRPLADLTYYIFNLGAPATVGAPLYLALSLIIGSLFCVAVARAFGVRSPLWTAVATLPILFQPYFLQNLSYTYDSTGMTLGLGFALWAALRARAAKSLAQLMMPILFLSASLLLYQPSASAFLPMVSALLIADWLGLSDPVHASAPKRGFGNPLFSLLIPYSVAVAIHAGLSRVFWLEQGAYGSRNSQVSGTFNTLLKTSISNVKVQVGVFLNDWFTSPGGSIFAFCLLICSLTLAWFLTSKRRHGNTQKPKI